MGVGIEVAVGDGVTLGPTLGPALGVDVGLGVVGPGVGLWVGVAEGAGCETTLLMLVRHVTVAPPPLPDPLHWFTVT